MIAGRCKAVLDDRHVPLANLSLSRDLLVEAKNLDVHFQCSDYSALKYGEETHVCVPNFKNIS